MPNLTFKKIPVCFCIDTNSSMDFFMDELCDGISAFYGMLKNNEVTKEQCEVSIVTFNTKPTVLEPFAPISKKGYPSIEVGGLTYTGAGVSKALEVIKSQQEEYKNADLKSSTPILVIVTNTAPMDNPFDAQQEVRKMEFNNELLVLPLGVGLYEAEPLNKFSKDRSYRVVDENFAGVFSVLAQQITLNSTRTEFNLDLDVVARYLEPSMDTGNNDEGFNFEEEKKPSVNTTASRWADL